MKCKCNLYNLHFFIISYHGSWCIQKQEGTCILVTRTFFKTQKILKNVSSLTLAKYADLDKILFSFNGKITIKT